MAVKPGRVNSRWIKFLVFFSNDTASYFSHENMMNAPLFWLNVSSVYIHKLGQFWGVADT